MATMQSAVQQATPWWMANSSAVDPLNNPYYGTAKGTRGENSDGSTLGAGNGWGHFDWSQVPGAESFINPATGSGDSLQEASIDPQKLSDFLAAKGWTLRQASQGEEDVRYLMDANGNVVGTPQSYSREDGKFYTGALLASAVVGSAVAGWAAAGGGAGASAGGAGSTAAADAVYAGSSAGSIGGGTGGAAATGGTTAATAGGGFWNGTDFTGTAAQAGSSNLGASAAAGANSMDWASLINTGLNIYGMSQAGKASDNATAAASEVAKGQLALSKEALDWYKKTYADEAPIRQAAADRQNAISDAQLKGMNFAIGQAEELDAYNKATFRPVEQRLVQEAQAYDTPERRMAAAASAAADQDVSAAATRQANDRALARAGVAPGSAKALAVAEDAALGQSVARGSSMTNAVRQTEQQGYARMADVANLGKGIATQQATQQGIATSTGNSSASTAGQALGSATSGSGLMSSGFNTAINANSSAGNLFNSVANSQRLDDQMLLTGIGQIGKSFAISDEGKKKGTGKMANAAQALKEVEATPVHDGWQYDPAKGGPDDGGQPHTGPMAQDVRRTMGDKTAPGGKAIDLVSMNGKMLLAVQALAKEVKALKKAAATDRAEDRNELEAA